ncbi:MAG: hypothetical protein QM405_00095 [Euryarchaeota archaeon]|jgi:hypothetical protein|nr:hypothetical protein [Euryarchaeota archaeon]
MPDWMVHVAVAWTLCRVLRFRFTQFDTPNTILVMVGSLMPDVVKIVMLFNTMGHDWWSYIYALHQPLGSFLVAAFACLFFEKKRDVFLFFSLGVLSHYALDLFLLQISGGLYLFFPFNWICFSLDLVPNDDYTITVVALGVALLVYVLGRWVEKKQDFLGVTN